MTDQPPTNRRTFFVVLALFFAPLLVAFFLYYGTGWRPMGGTNKGELISPAVPLPEVPLKTAQGGNTDSTLLRKTWTLVYLSQSECNESCQVAVRAMRNVRQLLGKDMSRTAATMLLSGECCEEAFIKTNSDITLVRVDDEAGNKLLASFPVLDGVAALQSGRIFMVDPLGNLMMSYKPGVDPRDIYKDLKKLLGLSHIG